MNFFPHNKNNGVKIRGEPAGCLLCCVRLSRCDRNTARASFGVPPDSHIVSVLALLWGNIIKTIVLLSHVGLRPSLSNALDLRVLQDVTARGLLFYSSSPWPLTHKAIH